MELKKLTPLDATTPATTPALNRRGGSMEGPSFQEALQRAGLGSPGVSAALKAGTPAVEGLKFSNHAVERMQSRGIRFSGQDMDRLQSAVERAAAKGSRDSLILMNDSALIVSVKNKTVVTVMDKNALKENVFTNIDSTIVM